MAISAVAILPGTLAPSCRVLRHITTSPVVLLPPVILLPRVVLLAPVVSRPLRRYYYFEEMAPAARHQARESDSEERVIERREWDLEEREKVTVS